MVQHYLQQQNKMCGLFCSQALHTSITSSFCFQQSLVNTQHHIANSSHNYSNNASPSLDRASSISTTHSHLPSVIVLREAPTIYRMHIITSLLIAHNQSQLSVAHIIPASL